MILPLSKLKQKFGTYLIRSKFKNFYYYYLEKKYRQNSDKRTLDIDWISINFNRIALVNFLLTHFQNPEYLEIQEEMEMEDKRTDEIENYISSSDDY